MSTKEDENSVDYAEKAFIAFNEIMSRKQKDMLENINRANRGELFILHYLSKCDKHALPSDLSAVLNISTARISALLGSLEKKGQIEREIDKSNRRNILVTITEAGREREKTEMREMKNCMTRVFIEMGEADTGEFIRLSRLFSELLQKHMTFQ